MIIRFKTATSIFDINVKTKQIRRVPENMPGSWKQYKRISKPRVGAPVLIVWAVDDKDTPTKSTVTSAVVSVENINLQK